MKKLIGKLFASVKGGADISGVVIDVALVGALIPVITGFIKGAQGNLTATEYVLLSLTTLFIILGLVFAIGKQAGLIKGKR